MTSAVSPMDGDSEPKDSTLPEPEVVDQPTPKLRTQNISCFVKFCKTRYPSQAALNKSLSFFYFPIKADKEAWKEVLGKLPNWGSPFNFEKSRLCELHFEEKYIVRSIKYLVGGKEYEVPCRTKLLPESVPSIFNAYEGDGDEQPVSPKPPKPKKPRPLRKKERKNILSATVNNNTLTGNGFSNSTSNDDLDSNTQTKINLLSATVNNNTNITNHAFSNSIGLTSNDDSDSNRQTKINLLSATVNNNTSITNNTSSNSNGLRSNDIQSKIVVKNLPITLHQQSTPTPTTFIILPSNCTLAGPLTVGDQIPRTGIRTQLISAPQIINVSTSTGSQQTRILPNILPKSKRPRKQSFRTNASNRDNVDVVELSDDFDSDSEFTPIKNDGSYHISLPSILLDQTNILMPSKCKRRCHTVVSANDLATLTMPTEDWSINVYKPEKTKTGKMIYTISETLLNSECVEITRKSITLAHDWAVKFTVFSHTVPRFALFACEIEDVQKALNNFARLKICSGFSKEECVEKLLTHTTLQKYVDSSFRSTNCCLVIRPRADLAYYYNSADELVCENCEFSI